MLKNLSGLALVAAFVFGAFHQISAQEMTFKAEDLAVLTKNASEKLEGRAYRSNTVNVFYKNGSAASTSTTKSIREFIPPDRVHYVFEAKDAKSTTRYELIRIGEKTYTRANDEEWKEGGSGSGMGSGIGDGDTAVKIERSEKRILKKGVLLNKQKVDFYETEVTVKYIYPNQTYTTVYSDSYWFNAGGMYVKTESVYLDNSSKNTSRNTTEYEYNPKIKIAAPILPKQKKT